MTSNTGWTGGRLNSGIGWTALFGAELNQASFATGDAILSSVMITNGSSLDMFFDVSFEMVISSSTIAAGANFVLWLMPLMQDGSTYGDNSLTTTPAAVTPGLYPKLIMPLRAATAQTALYGVNNDPLIMPPGSWAAGFQNNCGFTLASSGNVAKFRSYNINLSS
jgi:hypothetical protein